MSESIYHETHKLIRCSVVNNEGKSSVRLIEIEAFKMWEYLMSNKHGLQINDPMLCLWLTEEEYKDNAMIFQRSGEVEAVNKIIVDIFDSEYGFSHTIERYALDEETDQVIEILRSHIPNHVTEADACGIVINKGVIVQQWHHTQCRPAILGLES